MILLGCLIVLLAAGLAERLALARARRAVPIRIQVNGTRGKSTVTRLVAAALREAGIPTMAKVTGTEPRLILPDGSEQPIRRLAPATIREQAWALRQARRHGARALVAECMAIRPELQWTSERDILQSTLGVITNARLDHTEVMGRTVEEVARSLANTVPQRGVLVTGDRRSASVFAERCASEGTRLVVADDGRGDAGVAPEPVCLAVARELGVDEATARRGMCRAAPDPGAATSGEATVAGRRIDWIDLTAANDPESTDLLVERWTGRPRGLAEDQFEEPGRAGAVICVYNHRDDRPERLATFARSCRTLAAAAELLITGDHAALPLVRGARRACRGPVSLVPSTRLATVLARALDRQPSATRIVYCGNTRRFVRPILDR